MRYNGKNLKEVLEAHNRWLGESDGWSEDDRADLRMADLRQADLHMACLRMADLRGANLTAANLYDANLSKADMTDANLTRADLSRANLHEADLRGAYMIGADLNEADLTGTYLSGADLRMADLSRAYMQGAYMIGAILRKADLHGADLTDANMAKADLTDANLTGADLTGTKNMTSHIPMVCPTHGAFVGWKKACFEDGSPVIVKLLIPEDAKRSSATGRKGRCDKAQVLEIWSVNTDMHALSQQVTEARSMYDASFKYRVGEIVTPRKPFCEDRYNECASGIHFFVDLQEAINY